MKKNRFSHISFLLALCLANVLNAQSHQLHADITGTCSVESVSDYFAAEAGKYYLAFKTGELSQDSLHVISDKKEELQSISFDCDSSFLTKIDFILSYHFDTLIYEFGNISDIENLERLRTTETLLKATEIIEAIDSTISFDFYLYLVHANKKLGYLEKALDYSYKALNYAPGGDLLPLSFIVDLKLEMGAHEGLLTDLQKLYTYYQYKSKYYLIFGKVNNRFVDYHLLQNDYVSAKKYLDQTQTKFKQRWPDLHLLQKAKFYKSSRNQALEENTLLEYLKIAKVLPRAKNSLKPQLLLADHYLRYGNHETSRKYFNSVIDKSRTKQQETSLLSVPEYLAALIGLADVNLLSNTMPNQDYLDEAKEILFDRFLDMTEETDKLKLVENSVSLFKVILKHREKLGYTDKQLLLISEFAKGITLFDLMNKQEQIKDSLTPLEYQKYKQLQSRRRKLNDELSQLTDSDKLVNTKAYRDSKIREKDSIQNVLSSMLDASNSFQNDLDTIPELSLGKSELILEYFLYDSVGLVFVIDKDETNTYDLKLDSSFYANVEEFKSLLLDPYSDNKKFHSCSNNIYNTIFPFELESENITVIPHGILSSIPMEALINNQGEYLLMNHFISYAYSLKVLDQMKRKGNGKCKLLGFAPSYEEKVLGLKSLRFNQFEIEEIQKSFDDAKIFSNEIASKSNFLKHVEDGDILHLAGHADVNPNDPELSYVAFCDSSGEQDSTLLYSSQLSDLELDTKMIVLSACNTGIGRYSEGEGILSIARSFIHAGTASVVSTLWKVEDGPTKEIMPHFYQHLSKGKSKNEALTLAKRDYLAGSENAAAAHPNNWAAFILIGDTTPVFGKSNWLLVSSLIILVSLFLFYLFRKKRTSA